VRSATTLQPGATSADVCSELRTMTGMAYLPDEPGLQAPNS
jgi:hypothetical protein